MISKNFAFLTPMVSAILVGGCGNKYEADERSVPSLAAQNPQDVLLKITPRLQPTYGGVDVIKETVLPKPGSLVVANGDKINITGVFVDAVKEEAAAGVIAFIGDKLFVADYGGDRPDIAKPLNNPKHLKSQFIAVVPVTSLEKRIHDLKFRVIASDRFGFSSHLSLVS